MSGVSTRNEPVLLGQARTVVATLGASLPFGGGRWRCFSALGQDYSPSGAGVVPASAGAAAPSPSAGAASGAQPVTMPPTMNSASMMLKSFFMVLLNLLREPQGFFGAQVLGVVILQREARGNTSPRPLAVL